METFGAFSEGEWDSFNTIFWFECLDTVPCCLGEGSLPVELHGGLDRSASPDPRVNAAMTGSTDSSYCLDESSSNFHLTKRGAYSSTDCSSAFAATSSQEIFSGHQSNHVPVANNTSMSLGLDMADDVNACSFVSAFTDILTEVKIFVNEDLGNNKVPHMGNGQLTGSSISSHAVQLKRNDFPGSNAEPDCSSENLKKIRFSQDLEENKNIKMSTQGQKLEGRSSSSCSSENENASMEAKGGSFLRSKSSPVLNPGGKTRAGRGSAMDSQSLYARKRREKITERLRILQKLVPNGTKVDISTMLEEAVHYVKFLQLQIKLLSSDDLWMFAPIAYNGMDIGLHPPHLR